MIPECVFIPRETTEQSCAQEPAQGKRLLEPLKTFSLAQGAPIHILEDTNVTNEVEVHRHEGDLWICLSGEVEFVVGGSLVEPWAKKLPDGGTDDKELKANTIRGGTSHLMQEGDVLWIPAGQPHMHKTATTARLYIIKIPPQAEVPLADIPGWSFM